MAAAGTLKWLPENANAEGLDNFHSSNYSKICNLIWCNCARFVSNDTVKLALEVFCRGRDDSVKYYCQANPPKVNSKAETKTVAVASG